MKKFKILIVLGAFIYLLVTSSSAFSSSLNDTSKIFNDVKILLQHHSDKIDSLKKATKLVSAYDNTLKAKNLKLLGQYYSSHDLYDSAIIKFTQSSNIYLKLQDSLNYANLLRKIAIQYEYKGDYPITEEYYHKAKELFFILDNKLGLANVYSDLGILFWNTSEYAKALSYFDKSYIYALEVKDSILLANIDNNKGLVYWNLGNYQKALSLFYDGLKMYETIGDMEGVSMSYNNIGLIHEQLNEIEKALEQYNKCLEIETKLNNEDGMAITNSNISVIHRKLGDYTKALFYARKSLSIQRKLNYRVGIAHACENIYHIYLNLKNYEKAFSYNDTCFAIRADLNNKQGISVSHILYGRIYLATNNDRKAKDHFKEALSIAKDIGLLNEQIIIYKYLSEIDAKNEDYENAYSNYILYKALSDSVYNDENIKTVTQLQYQYEYEKEKQALELTQKRKDAIYEETVKRQKIVSYSFIFGFTFMAFLVLVILYYFLQKRKTNKILKYQKKKIQEDNRSLIELNKTKNKFFSIIAHDLRGPLGSLYNLGEFLWTSHDEFNNKERKKLLETITSNAKQTFNLLDNLLKWASSSSGEIIYKPKKFIINDLIDDNCNIFILKAETKNINLKNSLEEEILIFADYDMINTVVRNLISNAIKFTPEEGKIEIISNSSEEEIVIGVVDNGVGIQPEVLDNLFDLDSKFTSLGTNKEKGSGLGLKLCKEFVEKNGGQLSVESELGKGTTFWISLPRN